MPFCNYVQFYVKLHISATQGGRGGEVFVAKLFISTRLGDALKIEILLHVYIDNFLKKIFIPCRVGSKLFISKLIRSPPPLEIEWWPPKYKMSREAFSISVLFLF